MTTHSPTPLSKETAVHSLLQSAVERAASNVAIEDSQVRWTYEELWTRSRQAAQWLRGQGVGERDRVVLAFPNQAEWSSLVFGCSLLGATVVPISPALPRAQLEAVLNDAEPRLIILGPGAEKPIGDHTSTTIDQAISSITTERPADTWTDADPDDIAVLFYTSGSTGTSKGVMSRHRNVTFATRAIASRLQYRTEDRVFVALPLDFDYAFYQLMLATEATCTAFVTDLRRLGPRVLRSLVRSEATVVPVVPTLARMLCQLSTGSPGAAGDVRLFTNTGERLGPSSCAALRQAFPEASISLMYGLTECKRVTILEPDGDVGHPDSVGTALPGTEIWVVDEHGAAMSPGETGQLMVRGPHVTAGYWRRPRDTAERFLESSTLATGDYGSVSEDGHFYFVGRRDDIYKQHGMKVSAVQVEAAAVASSDLVEAAVVLPPREGGRAVIVVQGKNVDPAKVMTALLDRLPSHMLPERCIVVPAFPSLPNGKVDKHALDQMR